MIPILYEKTETAFTSNGLGRLSNCIRCIVTEGRNDIYEAEFDYPVTGVHFDDIQIGRIIACTHDEQGDVQPFDIYAKSEPINGVVTFRAHHISYRLNEITVKPFTAGSCAEALSKIDSQSVTTNPFTFWTNKSVTATFMSETPRKARAMLGGEDNSILDVYGTGEYEFDKFDVKLYLHRGQDTNVSIRYGKNLVDFNNDEDTSDVYTAIVPYWLGSETVGDESVTVLVTLPEWFLTSGHTVPSGREVIVPMDLSGEFSEKPSVSDLRTRAQSRLASSDGWLPNQTVTINFVQLWQIEEYKDYAPLQRLKLCDTCGVFVPMYNMSLRAKVIKVVYNVLLDRYDSMDLGDKPTTYAAVIEKQFDSKVAGIEKGFQAVKIDIQTVEQNAAADATQKANAAETAAKGYTDTEIASAKSTIESEYEQAIEDATELIRGGTGGYIVTTVNANGQPIELLITDNLDLNQAVNIWRWNLGGLAHSSSGYNGPFTDVAITQDGKINASMITTGILTANIIKAGILSDANNNVTFNLDTGVLDITKGSINLGSGLFSVNDNGYLLANSGKIASFNIQSDGFVRESRNLSNLITQVDSIGTWGYIRAITGYISHGTLTPYRSGGYYTDSGFMVYGQVGATSLPERWDSPSQMGDNWFSIQAYGDTNGNPYVQILTGGDLTGRWYGSQANYPIEFYQKADFSKNVLVRGSLTVYGTKPRAVMTKDYDRRLLYCYETPTPLFGDIGEAVLDEEGFCYVDVDDIFSETIADQVEYQVFLQKEGEGDCWIADKNPRYFVIQGTPGLKVAWELKAKQRDYEIYRFDLSESGLEEYANIKEDNNLIEKYITEQEELLYG